MTEPTEVDRQIAAVIVNSIAEGLLRSGTASITKEGLSILVAECSSVITEHLAPERERAAKIGEALKLVWISKYNKIMAALEKEG